MTKFSQTNVGTGGALHVMSQDKAARLRCPRVNGFFLEDDQSGRFLFARMGVLISAKAFPQGEKALSTK